MSKITIERPFDWCNQSFTNIYIDDENIGGIDAGKNIEFEVEPGKHKVAVTRGKSLFNKAITVDVDKGEEKTVRVVSHKYTKITWPILFIVLFAIYVASGISFEFSTSFVVLLLVYTVIIYIFKFINAKLFYYKMEGVKGEKSDEQEVKGKRLTGND